MRDRGARQSSLGEPLLIGSPIPDDSDLATALEEHENIGRVIWIDIPGDPFSGGIDVTKLPEMERHFVFIGTPATGADANQLELAAHLASEMQEHAGDDDTIRVSLPTSLLPAQP